YSEFKRQLAAHRPLPLQVLKLVKGIPKGPIPMEVARTAVSYMATFPRKKGETFDQFNRRESLQLTSTLPTIVASYERIRKGKTPIRPDPRLGHAANFLYGLSGRNPDEVSRATFETLSILYADHEMKPSTFAAVVVISIIVALAGAVTSPIATVEGERIVMDKRELWANIEFYAAVVLNALGVPKDLMPVVFACNRISGWIAHIYEQYADNRLIRPLTEYVGPAQVPYVPIDQRS